MQVNYAMRTPRGVKFRRVIVKFVNVLYLHTYTIPVVVVANNKRAKESEHARLDSAKADGSRFVDLDEFSARISSVDGISAKAGSRVCLCAQQLGPESTRLVAERTVIGCWSCVTGFSDRMLYVVAFGMPREWFGFSGFYRASSRPVNTN